MSSVSSSYRGPAEGPREDASARVSTRVESYRSTLDDAQRFEFSRVADAMSDAPNALRPLGVEVSPTSIVALGHTASPIAVFAASLAGNIVTTILWGTVGGPLVLGAVGATLIGVAIAHRKYLLRADRRSIDWRDVRTIVHDRATALVRIDVTSRASQRIRAIVLPAEARLVEALSSFHEVRVVGRAKANHYVASKYDDPAPPEPVSPKWRPVAGVALFVVLALLARCAQR
jgi:hypothetical protein